jgi:hypothetical protein
LWAPHGPEKHRVGLTAKRECVVRKRPTYGVKSGTTDWRLNELQGKIAIGCYGFEYTGRLSGNLGADAVPG